MNEDTEQKVKTTVSKKTDAGIFGYIGNFLYYVFVRNWRKKLLSLTIAVAVMTYSYGFLVRKDMERSRDVLIKNVSVEINLQNSEKYRLIGDTQKIDICIVVPNEISHSDENLATENFAVVVNANDSDVENGFVKIHLEDVHVKKHLDFEFKPKYFLTQRENSIHSTVKIPVEKEVFETRALPVNVKIDATGFSPNFTVGKKSCDPITVIAPRDVLDNLKIQTETIPLQGRVCSFQESVPFYVFVNTVECRNFIYQPERRTLCWTVVEHGQENMDRCKTDVAITLDRYVDDTVTVPVHGILLNARDETIDIDYEKLLSKIDWREMRKNQVTVTVRVSKADKEQWDKVKNKSVSVCFDLFKNAPDPVNVNDYSCETRCVLSITGIDVKIVDFEPKRIKILFPKPVAPAPTGEEKKNEPKKEQKDDGNFLQRLFPKIGRGEILKQKPDEKVKSL